MQWQKKKEQRTNNDLQKTTYKTKDRATQTPLKTGVNSGAPKGRYSLLHMWHPSCLLTEPTSAQLKISLRSNNETQVPF